MSLELGKFEVQVETGWMELVTGKFSAPQDPSHLSFTFVGCFPTKPSMTAEQENT